MTVTDRHHALYPLFETRLSGSGHDRAVLQSLGQAQTLHAYTLLTCDY